MRAGVSVILVVAALTSPLANAALAADAVEVVGTSDVPRTVMGAASGNGALYTFGGVTYPYPTWSDAIHRYVPGDAKSVVMGARLPSPRQLPAVAFDGVDFFIFGGNTPSGNLDEILRYSPATDTTVTMGAKLPSAREGANAVFDGRFIYIFGGDAKNSGHYGSRLDEILRYDPTADSITILAARLPRPVRDTAAVWAGDRAVMLGGFLDPHVYSDAIVTFDPATGTVATSVSKLPRALNGMSSVWDGTRVWAFGGSNACCRSDEIVTFEPATSQVTVETNRLPSGIMYSAATCQGSRVYVVGGDIAPSTLNTRVISVRLPDGTTCPAPPGATMLRAAIDRVDANVNRTRDAVQDEGEETRRKVMSEHEATRAHVSKESERALSAIDRLEATLGTVLQRLDEIAGDVSHWFERLTKHIDRRIDDVISNDNRNAAMLAERVRGAETNLTSLHASAAATEPLDVTLRESPTAVPGHGPWLVLVSLRGTVVDDPAITGSLDGRPDPANVTVTPRGRGSFFVNLSPTSLDAGSRMLLLEARWGTHSGNAIAWAGSGAPVHPTPSLPAPPAPDRPGPGTVIVIANHSAPLPGGSHVLPPIEREVATITGEPLPAGNYRVRVTIEGEQVIATDVAGAGVLPPQRVSLLYTPGATVDAPGGSVNVLVTYVTSDGACLIVLEGSCGVPLPGPLLGRLVARVSLRDASGETVEARELSVPIGPLTAGAKVGST